MSGKLHGSDQVHQQRTTRPRPQCPMLFVCGVLQPVKIRARMYVFYFGVCYSVLQFLLCELLPSRSRPLPGVSSLVLYRAVFAICGSTEKRGRMLDVCGGMRCALLLFVGLWFVHVMADGCVLCVCMPCVVCCVSCVCVCVCVLCVVLCGVLCGVWCALCVVCCGVGKFVASVSVGFRRFRFWRQYYRSSKLR